MPRRLAERSRKRLSFEAQQLGIPRNSVSGSLKLMEQRCFWRMGQLKKGHSVTLENGSWGEPSLLSGKGPLTWLSGCQA